MRLSSSSADLDALSGFRLGEEMEKNHVPTSPEEGSGAGVWERRECRRTYCEYRNGFRVGMGNGSHQHPRARRMMMASANLAVGNGWRGVAVRVVPKKKANHSEIDVVPRAVYCVHVLIG